MPMQVLINLFIGLLWMFFQNDWSALSFLSGYLFGLCVLFVIRRFLRSKFYLFTLHAVISLFLLFIWEMFISSILVIRKIITPQIRIKPGIVAMETSLEGDIEVTLLALLITLTPGSVVMEVSPDYKILYTHVMDIPELSDAVLRSRNRFEEAIKKVTRK
ncbi:MAG TPA: Na+/H+ antiporter subunit E [Peptococcaceae bacterium]|jgi:multicomponent Na+:H+ antiporter subunit E|nr:Na+/H+ antiporter subunit E [Clostridia bacterium]HOB82270.1 Na+/H+ antiporter subunit E [Peptococcaceae bacterium]HPZ70774.1 Na+/H+ antiporter subunit E [Peptococcaceae bacterium]HQD54044.1 Na+/H+ antiporter subunit E [Peptococcaceae bacterium]